MKPPNRTLFREYRENEGNPKDRRVAIKHTQKKKARKQARQEGRQLIASELGQTTETKDFGAFMTLEKHLKTTWKFNDIFKKPTEYAIKQVENVFGDVNYDAQQFDVEPDGDGGLSVTLECQGRTLEVVASDSADDPTDIRWERSVHGEIANPKTSQIEALKRWLQKGDTEKPSFY